MTRIPTRSRNRLLLRISHATVSYLHQHVELALFATNLFDTKYLESYLDSSLLSTAGFPPALSHDLGIQGDRRRFGVRASYHF